MEKSAANEPSSNCAKEFNAQQTNSMSDIFFMYCGDEFKDEPLNTLAIAKIPIEPFFYGLLERSLTYFCVNKFRMKKIYIVLSLLLFSFISQAQFVDLHNEVNSMVGDLTNTTEELSAHWDIINITGSTKNIRCRREIVQTVPSAQHQYCWGELCGPWTSSTNVNTSSQIVTLGSGDTTTTFFCKYKHFGNAGESIVRFCWYDNNNNALELCHEITFCAGASCPVGIIENEAAASFEIIGNPVNSISALKYQFQNQPSQASVQIFSATGVLVEERPINSIQGFVVMDAENFANGVYLCRLVNGGRVAGTQRMVVSK
jgi:hypothetical protein